VIVCAFAGRMAHQLRAGSHACCGCHGLALSGSKRYDAGMPFSHA
jgi:hypothetical protein